MDAAALGRVVWACAARAQRPTARQRAVDRPQGSGDAVVARVLRHRLRQSTGTTCGSACLVLARALLDAGCATWLLDGVGSPEGSTGCTDGRRDVDVAARFASAEQVVHRRTTAARRPGGGWQLPWPRALGTPPWGVAHELTWIAASVDRRTRFRTRLVDPDDERSRRAAVDAVAATVRRGWCAALFVGDGRSPRHVVLVLPHEGSELAVYEPGSGQVVRIPREDLVAGHVVLGGWDRLWAVVVGD